MKHLVRLAISAMALVLPASALQASGDYGCTVRWKLTSRGYDCANRAVLSPGNDSRVNLFFLLRDRQDASLAAPARPADPDWEARLYGKTFFSWGRLRDGFYPGAPSGLSDGGGDYHGSRCVSLASGGTAFAAAVAANGKLSQWEREQLVTARGKLVARCSGGDTATGWPASIRSGPGREFLAYLQAAEAFYGEQWDAARAGFAGLGRASDPWVAEAATYMLPRTELNAAQAAAFDEYGSFAGAPKVDAAALGRAKAGFADYLKRYAKGAYAASAGGLQRRLLWLGGDAGALSREYERLLAATPAREERAADLVEEIDNKLLLWPEARGSMDGPMLLATIDLMRMRGSEDPERPDITADQIAAQQPRFAGRADLFSFVQASHAFYVRRDMREVLRLIPDDARRTSFSPLQFSRQMLRGMALAAIKDRNEAGFWQEMLPGAAPSYQRPAVELALAMNWERGDRLADVFAAGSPIGDEAIREILLIEVAGPALLRAQARASGRPKHERDVAAFTLLYKQLLFADYAGFLRDSPLAASAPKSEQGLWNIRQQDEVPLGLFRNGRWSDGYACGSLSTTVAVLSRNPRDAKARLCLGDFYRLNGFDDYGLDGPEPDELGGTPTRFPGRAVPRSAIYADIIADAAAAPDAKAYALYRAVNCYAPNGGNACGGEDVPQARRQQWFQRLKRDFPQSEWARKLRYYW